ncbi:MAG: hypothetical protein H6506_03165 [Calditrichaeota bacterium]|nr:hypothetical protein [Calditrichota bacterium]MCB9391636.1 hypothetical protein [Calditrichota bacterium]
MPLFVLLLALSTAAFSNPFRWTTYTSGTNVRDLLVMDSNLWLGTSGGLVHFDPATGEFDLYTNTRGLAMNATVGVGADAQGWIWVVAPDGRITRLNPQTGATKVISDLKDEIFEVTSIIALGDEMFLAANNGIYRFAYFPVVDNYRVSERVRVLGNFPTSIAISDMVVVGEYLYASTIAGLARAPLATQQFSAPAVWENFTTAQGLPQNNITKLGVDAQQFLWVAMGAITTTFDGANFSAPINCPETLSALHTFGGQMHGAGSSTLFRFDGTAWVSTGVGQPGMATMSELDLDGDSFLVIGVADRSDREGGLRFYDGQELAPAIAPHGLGGNHVAAVEFDAFGNLWAATREPRAGVSRFANEEWTAFTRSDSLDGQFWSRGGGVSAEADEFGGMWFASDGGGVVYYRDDEFYRYNPVEQSGWDSTGARLAGIPDDASYCECRIGKMPTGEILITNLGSTSERPMVIVTRDWLAQGNNLAPWVYPYPSGVPQLAQPEEVTEIYGEPFGRFFAGASRNGSYTFVCDTRGTFADTTDDVWDAYRPTDRQDATTCFDDISSEVLAFAVDKQYYLWAGTASGAYYSQGGLTGNVDNLRFICLFDLPIGRRVNDIHVDAQDNKWFATDQGVAVLDPSFTWVHVFQTSSSIDFASDLASNNVLSITSSAETGELWIATADGLSRLETPYVSRKPELDKVIPYPNPFRADGSQRMFLDANDLGGRFDELRVFTLNGRLVRKLSWSQAISSGWDGRNQDGDLIAGGVYLIVATTSDGHSATGKIAVLGR